VSTSEEISEDQVPMYNEDNLYPRQDRQPDDVLERQRKKTGTRRGI